MVVNRIVNLIIKLIYAQIFSRVNIRRQHRAINRTSRMAARAFLRPPRKCRITPADAGGLPGEWSDPGNPDAGRFIFYIHGGGFSLFSAAFYRDMVCRISAASAARALSFNYRLSPEYPYPAGLEDCVTAYTWMLSSGIGSSRIAVMGDSAGGGLALSLLQRLRDSGIGLPACAVCISAWADLTLRGEQYDKRKKGDHLFRRTVLEDCAANYLQEKDPSNPSISPVFGDFSRLPPLLFQAGGDEVLLADSQMSFRKARDAGTAAELQVWPGMVHDFHLWSKVLPDGRKAIITIGEFVKKHIP